MNFLLKMILLNKTEEAIPDYQPWDSFPDTPDLTVDYPYQFVLNKPGYEYLLISKEPMKYRYDSTINFYGDTIRYSLSDGSWTSPYAGYENGDSKSNVSFHKDYLAEANYDILWTNDTLLFAKTT